MNKNTEILETFTKKYENQKDKIFFIHEDDNIYKPSYVGKEDQKYIDFVVEEFIDQFYIPEEASQYLNRVEIYEDYEQNYRRYTYDQIIEQLK